VFQFSAIQTAARENARPTVVETSFEIFHGDPVTTRSIPPDHNASFSVAVALLALAAKTSIAGYESDRHNVKNYTVRI
jgi:hypothetical protein